MKRIVVIRELLPVLPILVLLTACKRELRPTHPPAYAAQTPHVPSESELQPGPTTNEISTNFAHTNVVIGTNYFGTNTSPGSFIAAPELPDLYKDNAWAMAEGKVLFQWFNCVGCHGHGGGGMGPALMDDKWLYGSDPRNIYASIAQGRPNGMPAFYNRIPEYMIWQLTMYVRSISGIMPMDAAPGRSDHMQTKPAENTKDPEKPKRGKQ